jgi:hypothetical protein
MHGGKSPTGPASPHWQTGRYSRSMPTDLLASYEAAATDQNQLALRDEIAVIEARMGALLSGLSTAETGERWAALGRLWAALTDAQRAQNAERAVAIFAEVGQTITAGAGDQVAWREITDLIERRRRLVDTETRRLQIADETVSRADAGAILLQIGVLVREHVKDRAAVKAISEGLRRYLGQPSDVPELRESAGYGGEAPRMRRRSPPLIARQPHEYGDTP